MGYYKDGINAVYNNYCFLELLFFNLTRLQE